MIVQNPLVNQKSSPQIQPSSANDAIKLALKKLSERSLNGNADYNRVSQLAQQLAKVIFHKFRASTNFKIFRQFCIKFLLKLFLNFFSSTKVRKNHIPDQVRQLFKGITDILRLKRIP